MHFFYVPNYLAPLIHFQTETPSYRTETIMYWKALMTDQQDTSQQIIL